MQTIIPEKPKCYGDKLNVTEKGFQCETAYRKCPHLDACEKVSLNLFLAKLKSTLQYNYPELRNTYENY